MNTDKQIVLTMTKEDAEFLSWNLSDLLCWCRGYRAALPDFDFPFETEVFTTLNINLKKQIK